MRVLLVGPYPVDAEHPVGGVQSSISNLLHALGRQPDLDVHGLSFVPGLRRPFGQETHGVTMQYVGSARRLGFATGLLRERLKVARAIRSLRPDVVHAQDSLVSGYSSLRASKGVPVIVSIHGIVREEVHHLPNGLERVRMQALATRFERHCVREARFLVAPTRYPELYFGDEIRGRIRAVGNPIADAFFAIEHRPQPGLILFAGAVTPLKRLLDLVEALPAIISAVPSARLIVAGSAVDGGYVARVQSRVRALSLEERVTFAGQLRGEEMRAQYARACVLVLPSAQEASPMVIGEAMAAGVPVVATRVGGVEYLVEHGTTGYLVELGSVDDLGSRISGVLADAGRASALGAAARKKAEQTFKADVVAGRLRAVYEEAVGG